METVSKPEILQRTANVSTARRSSSWMELMSWMIISMLMPCLSKKTHTSPFCWVGMGWVVLHFWDWYGLPSQIGPLFFLLDLGFQVGFPHSPALSQSEYGWWVLFTKTRNKMGHGFVLKDRWMSKPPCAWLIFRADTLISMVTKFTLWQKRNKKWWGSSEKDNNYNYPITSFNFRTKCVFFW